MQCLSNPRYLHHLASTLSLEDERVINYLKYLRYWKDPQYVRYIRFPRKFVFYLVDTMYSNVQIDCLYFLDLLQDKTFRQKLKSPEFIELIFNEQFYHWLYYNGKQKEAPDIKPTVNEEKPV